MKKKLSLLLSMVLVVGALSVPTIANDSQDIKIIVSGNAIECDQPPVIVDGRTLIPLRAVAESVGAEVNWDAITKTVSIENDKKVLNLTIGNKYISYQEKTDNSDIVLVPIDVPAQVMNDRTMVPLRVVAETLGIKVDWDAENKTVNINKTTDEVTTSETSTASEETTEVSTIDENSTEVTSISESTETTTSEEITKIQVLLSSDRKNLGTKTSSETITDSVVVDEVTLFSIKASYGTIEGNDAYNTLMKEMAQKVVDKEMNEFEKKTKIAYEKLEDDEKHKFVPYSVDYSSKVEYTDGNIISTVFTTKYCQKNLVYKTIDDFKVTDNTGKNNLTISDLTGNKVSTETAMNAAIDKFQELFDADKTHHYLDKIKENGMKESMITYHIDMNGNYVFSVGRGIISPSDNGIESVIIPSTDLLKLK